MRTSIFAISFVVVAGITACLDVVHEDQVDALGDEAAGVPEGPRHRPGQTCTVCHGGKGPGSPEFSVGGTVYLTRGTTIPAPNIEVKLTDARNNSPVGKVITNDVGNFYVNRSDWDPTYPIKVKLIGPSDDGGVDEHEMITNIGGDGGCAKCHQPGLGDRNHMPGVYFQ